MSFSAQTWRDQRERRYHPSPDAARALLGELVSRLPVVRYDGCDTSFVVTTYLDTRDGHYLAKARADGGVCSLKLRIREYLCYDAASRTHRVSEVCYLERKERVNDLRLKERIPLPKREVAHVVAGRRPVPGDGAEACAIRRELDTHDLRPVMVSAYERRVFGDERSLRVTFDERVAYYAPPDGLYEHAHALTPEVLGPPRASGPSRILEVKQPSRDTAPAWLDELLAALPMEPAYSKFSDGMLALADADDDARDRPRRLAPGH